MKEKHMEQEKLKKINVRKVIVYVVMAIVVAIAGLVMYSEKVHKIGFIENIKHAIEEQINPSARSTEASDVTIVDVTGIMPGDVGSHVCSEYYISKYDETNHWNECKICGKEYDKVAHNFVDNGWTAGSSNSCVEDNVHQFSCACGYGYTNIIGRKEHHYVSVNLLQGSYLWKACDVCWTVFDREFCYKEDGTRITCKNPGRCVYCNYNYGVNTSGHFMGINFNAMNKPFNEPMVSEIDEDGNANCAICGEYLAHINYNYVEKVSDNVFKYYTSITVPDGAVYNNVRLEGDILNVTSVSNTPTITGNTWNNVLTITLNQKIEYPLIAGVIYNGTYNGRNTDYYFISDWMNPDEEAPVINSINQDEDAPWEKRKEITISGTENYCSSVNVEILDGEEIIYTGTASVKNNKWSITAVPELEADEVGRNLSVRVIDPLENSSTKEFPIKKVDAIEPELVEESIVIGGDWAKEKRYTFRATDSGVGNVSIAFNDLGEYGVASIDGTTYSREYKLVGDVYEPRQAVVYYKDELGNTKAKTITIDKLDNTGPTITGASLTNNILTVMTHDRKEGVEGEGSGVAKYRYITSRSEERRVGKECM